jgi:hypothetical protein
MAAAFWSDPRRGRRNFIPIAACRWDLSGAGGELRSLHCLRGLIDGPPPREAIPILEEAI